PGGPRLLTHPRPRGRRRRPRPPTLRSQPTAPFSAPRDRCVMTKRFLRGAASALFCLLACQTDVAHAPASSSGSTSDSTPDPLQPSVAWPPGQVCLLDADCGVGRYCELRVCVDGCEDA